MPKAGMEWARRWAPEATLAVLAAVVFLGFLGAVDLWGKREQRASVEALDTIDHGHWLVAQIQGRKRLEKPPLPRWTIATLIQLTGRRDEWMVRIPSALAALGMVGLVYGLGRRLGGRPVGLASGLVLTSLVFFISELRQAGNDGPLAFFTTLALYAAWRRLHGGPAEAEAEQLGARGWAILMYVAMGLGFLTKGPIVLILVALTLVPYLATAGRLRSGLRALADPWGLLLFVLLALSWPVPVLLSDPKAARVWYLEMAQKAGSAGIQHHRQRLVLAADWPWMTFPWTLVAALGVILPFLPAGRAYRPKVWFPWFWAVGNLAMFCFWKVAKPNYYLPCLPGAALLIGLEWVRLCRSARGKMTASAWPRRALQAHWVLSFAAALIVPVVVAQVPETAGYLGWTLAVSAAVAVGVVASVWAWRRGSDAGALTPLVASLCVFVLVAYGAIAPGLNPDHSHRDLAAKLDRLLPPEERTVMFYHELDEGLWFYLNGRSLKPVPGSQPEYNSGFALVEEARENRIIYDPVKRLENEKQVLLNWIGQQRSPRYVLIRTKVYDLFASSLQGLATPIYREPPRQRNELVLLRVPAPRSVASRPMAPAPR